VKELYEAFKNIKPHELPLISEWLVVKGKKGEEFLNSLKSLVSSSDLDARIIDDLRRKLSSVETLKGAYEEVLKKVF